VLEFHAEAPQSTASKGLAQGPYMAALAEVEPTTLQTIGRGGSTVADAGDASPSTSNNLLILVKQYYWPTSYHRPWQ